MLIDSEEVYERINVVMQDAIDNIYLIRSRKDVIRYLEALKHLVISLEAVTSGKNAQHKYAEALQGLKDK